MTNEKWKILFCACLLLALSSSYSAQTPPDTDVDVPIIDEVHSRLLGAGFCFRWPKEPGPVIDEESFRKLISEEPSDQSRPAKDRCAFLKQLKIDFSKHSLLAYGVGGDCFVRASAKVSRNDTERKYTVWVTRRSGVCRAAGSFQGWLVVDKLLPDYKVETVVSKRDDYETRE